MPEHDWKPVANALLGSWPSQVASWGREVLAAYLAELEARSVTPAQALVAIRACPADQTFPPSAPEMAALARRDPGRPTFAEMCVLVFGPHGVLRARTPVRKGSWDDGERDRLDAEAMWERAQSMHPLIARFIRDQGLDQLRRLNLDDQDWGQARRQQLQHSWDGFVDAYEGREVAAIAAGRRGGLGRLDPLEALGMQPPAQLAAHSTERTSNV